MTPVVWTERTAPLGAMLEGHTGVSGSDTFVIFLFESAFMTPQPIGTERSAPAFSTTERTAPAPAFVERNA